MGCWRHTPCGLDDFSCNTTSASLSKTRRYSQQPGNTQTGPPKSGTHPMPLSKTRHRQLPPVAGAAGVARTAVAAVARVPSIAARPRARAVLFAARLFLVFRLHWRPASYSHCQPRSAPLYLRRHHENYPMAEVDIQRQLNVWPRIRIPITSTSCLL